MGVVARQSIKASIVGIVGVCIGAIFKLFIATHYLTESEIGLIETLIKLGILISPAFVFGSASVITRFYTRFKSKAGDGGLLLSYSLILFLSISISSVIYLFFKENIASFYTNSPEIKQFMFVPLFVCICIVLYNFFSSISLVNLRITIPSFFVSIVNRAGVFIWVLFYGYWAYLNMNQLVWGYMILFYLVPLVCIIYYVTFIIRPIIQIPTISAAKNIYRLTYRYNVFLLFSSFSGIIIQAIDVNMISGSLGINYSGIYIIAFYMGTVIDIPRRSLSRIAYPVINEAYNKNDFEKVFDVYKKSSLNQLLVGLFIFSLVWFNIDSVFNIIPNGEIYRPGKYVVLFIGIAKLFDMATGVNRQIIEISPYYKYNLLINLLMSVLVIVFNLIFIHRESSLFGGINGVAFASLLAMTISNSIAIGIVWHKENMFPFSRGFLKAFIPFIVALPINHMIVIQNDYISILIKGLLITIVFILTSILFKISTDFRSLLRGFIKW